LFVGNSADNWWADSNSIVAGTEARTKISNFDREKARMIKGIWLDIEYVWLRAVGLILDVLLWVVENIMDILQVFD
jgi:hypothetical protein